MKRMVELMEQSELDEPKLIADGNSFSITLPHKSVFTSQQEQWLLMFQQFNLTGLQKRILLLGMNDREISPAEIYKAINTDDRNVYDAEVTALRKRFLLHEIRTNPQANLFARRNQIPKPNVPRFRVQVPGVSPAIAHVPARQSQSQKPSITARAVVKNLPWTATEATVEELLSKCGPIKKVDLLRYRETQESKGYAFVWFENADSVDLAIRTISGQMLENRELLVEAYRER